MLTLRPYQESMLSQAREKMRAGCRRIILQSSTGSGKTVLAARMLANAAAKGKRSWFICHRKEILDQSIRTFVLSADLHVGIVAAGYPSDAAAPVQVCAVGSLKRRASKIAAPDFVVWDESHHIAAASWSEIAKALPNAIQIGLTATPIRADSRGLRQFFDDMVMGPSTAELIAAGFLAPYKLFAPSTVDLTAVHTLAVDYNRKEADVAMRASAVVGDAISTYEKHAPSSQALVFAWSVESSHALASAFTMRGIPAVHLDGDTDKTTRDRAMADFRKGATRVICSCQLFTEGLDVVGADAVFLLRPTQSLGLYLQMIGRGLRPSPGKTCLVFDHVGNYARHGLPDDPRVWTLDGVTKAARKADLALKRCASCFAIASAASKVCPYCQVPYPVKQRKVVRVDGELGEVDLAALRGQVRELQRECHTLAEWQALGKKLGYKAGWSYMAWQRSKRHRRVSA